MMEEILVPLDGSRFAEYALPAALSVADRSGARLRLASVVTDVPPVPFTRAGEGRVRGWFEEARSRTEQYLEKVGEKVKEEAGGKLEVRSQVLVGPAIRMLAGELEESPSTLLVMTTHGRGPLERAWVGSVTDGLVRRVTNPILLMRPQKGGEADLGARPAFEQVVIPLDGSETAEAILDSAAEFVSLFQSQVTLLSVLPEPFPVGSSYLPHVVEESVDRDAQKKGFEAYLDEIRGRLEGKARSVSTVVVDAEEVASGILSETERRQADLVAMSTHGRSGVTRLVVGSVADKVIRGGSVPVFVRRAT